MIKTIYAVERAGEREGIKTWDKIGNKMLLWHGTKPENVVGVLQTGFRIAPSDASNTGSMFGEGVYFADIFNKSYNYTSGVSFNSFGSGTKVLKKPKKYLFLCEVALGNMKKLYMSENVTNLPTSSVHSVMGVGQVGPDPTGNIFMPNGSILPMGKLVNTPQPKLQPGQWWQLQHNEYVVYDTTQIRVRYLFELRDTN
jgi:hypothetical protein